MKGRRTSDGFTLAEMLVTLAILALMTAVSLPYLHSSANNGRLDVIASQIASRFKNARSDAIFSNAEKSVSLDLKKKAILADASSPELNLPNDAGVSFLTARSEIQEDISNILFFADGSSSGGQLTLSRGSDIVAIKINWLSGAINVEKSPAK